jgi:hypothetical protein
MPPKELSAELCSRHGLCLTADYIRAIRTESVRLNDGTFLRGLARVSDLRAWIAKHPEFRRAAVRIAA